MKFYLDTEFNSFGGDLISLALVGDGIEFYAARQFIGPPHPWVKEHVLPVLGIAPLTPQEFVHSFQYFIKHFDGCEVVCDWFEDAAHFLNLLRGKEYGSSLKLACTINLIRTPDWSTADASAIPHNALADARALKAWYESNR